MLAVLVIVAATVAPVALVNQTVTRHFRIGLPLLSLTNVDAGGQSRFGSFPVQRKRHYQIELEATGAAAFQVYLDYQDGVGVKKYDPPLSFDERAQVLYPVTQAVRDDPAASVVIDAAQGLHVGRLTVCEINRSFYVWRAAVRTGASVALVAGMSLLGWRYYRHRSSVPLTPGWDRKAARRTGALAATLLTLAGSFSVFFLQSQHARLFRQPPQSSIRGWDGAFYYFWLRSAAIEGDFDFSKDLRYCNTMSLPAREEALRDTPRTSIGRFPNKYPIGWALLEAPWYVAADTTARLVNALGGQVRRDGWQPLYQVFLIAGQIVYAAGGLWLAYRFVAGILPHTLAVCGVVLGWMCSPLAYYQIIDLAMSHNVMFFALMVSYHFAGKLRAEPTRLRHWVTVGLGCAFVILSRYQGAVMLLFPGVVCLQAVWRDRRCWRGMACGIAASVVPLALQATAWKAVYGSYLLYTYEGEGFNWAHPHLYEVLFSPHHGLFNWHPALMVGFLGFAAWAVTTPQRTEAWCFAVSLLSTIYVNGSWWCWWFGDSFGSRAFEGCTLYAMLGFGWLLHMLVQRTAAFTTTAVAVLLAGLWNMNLLWLSNDGPLVLSKPIPWVEKIALNRRYWSEVF